MTENEDTPIDFVPLDFVTNFSDVDGDSLDLVKILSLPTNGSLQLSGVPIVVNQEIAVANLG